MIISNGKKISNIYSLGKELQRVYSLGQLVWEKKAEEEDDYDKYYNMPFTVKAVDDNVSVNVQKISKSDGSVTIPNMKYSLNGGEWRETNKIITLNKNDRVSIITTNADRCYIKGYYDGYNQRSLADICGNIMSLIYGDNFIGQTVWKERNTYYAGTGFFSSNDIRNANNLILPATSLSKNAYKSMFNQCNNLITAPELPATELAPYCYYAMFSGSSIIQAPALPATELAENCYEEMFAQCDKLSFIKCLATDISATKCTYRWVAGVLSSGTFVCPEGVSWTRGKGGIPENWTVEYMD